MRRLRSLILVVFTLVGTSAGFIAPAVAERRVALVIGNSAYQHTSRLLNPRSDAEDVAAALKRAEFDTIVGLDLTQAGMQETVIRFARAARDADIALFYYAGHAMQFAGINYLLPVDVRLTDEADLRRMTRVDEIVEDLKLARNLRILVLDACRDNPLAEEFKRSIGASRSASVQRGLARIESPQGTIISFATQAGRTAEDGKGRNSPYTSAFLKHIETQEEIGNVFRSISEDVYQATRRAQLPELSLSLVGRLYLKGQPPAVASRPVEPLPRVDPCGEAGAHWRSAEAINTRAAYEDHLRHFPNCAFAGLARARIEGLDRVAVVAPPVRPAAPPLPQPRPAVGIVPSRSVKVGFVSTFSGPTAAIGNDMRNSFELALDHLSRKLGGLPVEMIYEDDQLKPDAGKQKAEKLVQSDKVDFVVGYIWSNVLLASLKTVVDAQTFLIGTNAGPSQIAGELCSPFFFSTSWQSDQIPHAIGEYLNQKGVRTLFLMGPNYTAGNDILAAVTAAYRGRIAGQEVTRWPDQLDFSVSLTKARAAAPDAAFAFYPGAAGVQFLTQYAQAGLKGRIPLYTAFTVDAFTLGLQRDAALGVLGAQHWVQDLPNDANRKYVAEFRARHRSYPTFYGAQSYDAAFLIHSAVEAVRGDLANKDGMRAEMRRANFASVRGPYKYGNNHFPIQSIYLQEAVKDTEGNQTLKTVATIVTSSQDKHHGKCPMRW